MYKNQELIEVFEDTKKHVKDNDHDYVDTKSKLISNNGQGDINVYDLDTVTALTKIPTRLKSCVLNMASEKKAGGGVKNGAKAQEESLFRCSNLFDTVDQKYYPLSDDELIYTNDAAFFKDKKYEYMREVFFCDVVTIAAINLNKNSKYDDIKKEWVDGIVDKEDDYEALMKNKIRFMLHNAIKNDVDVMILGAWGCGVFKNDPNEVARMFKEVLIDEHYARLFIKIVFAVINDRNSVADNYQIFYDTLNNSTRV
jgi:uncharacterized protein (TIGR02452 family)